MAKEVKKISLNLDDYQEEPTKIPEGVTLFDNDGGVKTKRIEQDRAYIKETLRRNLEKGGFNEEEIASVMKIVTDTEHEIAYAKNYLVGTNINNDDPSKVMHVVFNEIQRLQAEMAVKIRHQIYEIQLKKQDPEAYAKRQEEIAKQQQVQQHHAKKKKKKL